MNQTSRTKKFIIIKKHITDKWLRHNRPNSWTRGKGNFHYHKGWFSFEIEQINCCIKKDFLFFGEEETKGMDFKQARMHAIRLAITKYMEKINREYSKEITELIRCKAPYSCRLVYTHHKTHKKHYIFDFMNPDGYE
jgi:hypothetical protein